jgi:hypothetical protein
LKHITLQDYLNHKDVSQIGLALCDSVIVNDEENPWVQEEVIKKGQIFEPLDAIKLFFRTTLYVTIDHTMWQNQTKTYITS